MTGPYVVVTKLLVFIKTNKKGARMNNRSRYCYCPKQGFAARAGSGHAA